MSDCCASGVAGGASPPPVASRNSDLYRWGNQNLANGTQYLFPWSTTGTSINIEAFSNITPVEDGNLELLFVRHSNPVAGGDVTYTVRINGIDTGLTLVLNSAAASGVIVLDVPFTAFDVITLQAAQATGGTLSNIRTAVSVGVRYG